MRPSHLCWSSCSESKYGCASHDDWYFVIVDYFASFWVALITGRLELLPFHTVINCLLLFFVFCSGFGWWLMVLILVPTRTDGGRGFKKSCTCLGVVLRHDECCNIGRFHWIPSVCRQIRHQITVLDASIGIFRACHARIQQFDGIQQLLNLEFSNCWIQLLNFRIPNSAVAEFRLNCWISGLNCWISVWTAEFRFELLNSTAEFSLNCWIPKFRIPQKLSTSELPSFFSSSPHHEDTTTQHGTR